MPAVTANIGTATIKRFLMGFWSKCKKSAMISRAERNAVSPEVTAALMTPRMVIMAITLGNQVVAMMPTMLAPGIPLTFTLLSGPKK